VDASRESSDALLKGCGQLLMTTETSLVSSGSYMRSTSSASAKSLSSSPAGIKVGNVLLLIPSIENPAHRCKFGTRSPVGSPTIREAAEHLVRKIGWFSDELVYAKIVTPEEVSQSRTIQNEILTNVNCLIAFHLTSPSDMATASELFQERKANSDVYGDLMSQFAIECDTMGNASSKDLSSFVVGKYDSSKPSLVSQLFPWTKAASHRRLQESMASLFERSASDDFVLALMLFFNQCTPSGISIPWVECSIDATWEKGFIRNAKELFSMITKCGPCIAKCMMDPQCSKCLKELTALDTRDQVTSYRTIVSYESELLRDFSLCILQKNNIFGCYATIPDKHHIPPIKHWKGKDLTQEDARQILIGHLDEKLDLPQVSWKVAAGANEAYDQFPSQNQLFYTGVNGKDMWYDPVFRVNTVDDRHVWCKRHYRVRDGPEPGTFRLSVLDNGVTSNEFWTIAGVADDLSWVVFSYAGAASAVGQRYLGGLLCTPDGLLPPSNTLSKIWKVLEHTTMAPWEMFLVNNDDTGADAVIAGPPPLNFYRADILNAKKSKGLV
jgi:hypothetical protein